MTPTATQLQQRLNDRRSWFINQWFFPWHQLRGNQYPVKVEMFDGRTTHMGGIEFCGSARQIYWDAITRGVRKEIVDQFSWVDDQVRRYNHDTAERAIDECAGLLVTFARGIRREAVSKDRILRGNGIDFPPENDAGRWGGTSPDEIQKQADSLKRSLPVIGSNAPAMSEKIGRAARWNALWHRHQWWIGPSTVILGIGLTIAFA